MNKNDLLIKVIGSVIFINALVSCQKPVSIVQSSIDKTVEQIPCSDGEQIRAAIFWEMKAYVLDHDEIPKYDDIENELEKKLTSEKLKQYLPVLKSVYRIITDDGVKAESVKSPSQYLQMISALDVGEMGTEYRRIKKAQLEKLSNEISQLSVKTKDLSCPAPPPKDNQNGDGAQNNDQNLEDSDDSPGAPSPNPPVTPAPPSPPNYAELHPAVRGLFHVVTTAYQNCDVQIYPPMDAETPDVQGISIVGTHPDGIGSKRIISNLGAVQATHFYLQTPQLSGANCFDVRNKPLIYDYGGKPFVNSQNQKLLSLFKNAGDGTKELGIDCSGFVFTAYATAGLNLKENRALQAVDAYAWGSGAYVEPQKNGLTCLQKISVTPTKSIQAGDIIALQGHVVMVRDISADPFGIKKTTKVEECDQLTVDDFDFTIGQSSNSKAGIGINFFKANDYFRGGRMGLSLLKYGIAACKAYWTNKTLAVNTGVVSVVRHKGGKACQSQRVQLANESCVQQCSRIN